jgi:hypothetical protein
MIRQLDDVLDKYMTACGQTTLCQAEPPSEECDVLILGSLVKSCKSAQPAIGHRGMSIRKLLKAIEDFRLNFVHDCQCTSSQCYYRERSSQRITPSLTGKCKCGSQMLLQESHLRICSPMPALLALLQVSISSVPGMDLEAQGRIPAKGLKWQVMSILPDFPLHTLVGPGPGCSVISLITNFFASQRTSHQYLECPESPECPETQEESLKR